MAQDVSFFAIKRRNVAVFVAVRDAVSIFATNLHGPVDQFIFRRRFIDVRFVEKSTEQNEVGEIDGHRHQSGRQRRLATGRGVNPIGRKMIDVQNVQAKKGAHQKLRNLHGGYKGRQKFWALPTGRFHRVIGVHESVYEIIHENAPSPGTLFHVVDFQNSRDLKILEICKWNKFQKFLFLKIQIYSFKVVQNSGKTLNAPPMLNNAKTIFQTKKALLNGNGFRFFIKF
uniref:Ribosomal protein L2 n=1 Tax=Romanomermis culicivorax TaxID=13658 RepID=A0A915HK03_ROMCU